MVRTILIAALLLMALPAGATIYYWTDDKGVVHITDNLKDVPEPYRGRVKSRQESPSEPSYAEPAPTLRGRRDSDGALRQQLYGGHSLEWWQKRFIAKRRQIKTLRQQYQQKRRFIDVFEKGRRFGRTFSEEEIDSYNRYREELSELEKAIEEAEQELEELIRNARASGVPRDIRGE